MGIRAVKGTVMEVSHVITITKRIDMRVGSMRKLSTTWQVTSRMSDHRLPRSRLNLVMMEAKPSQRMTPGKSNHTRKIGGQRKKEDSLKLAAIRNHLMEARSEEIHFSKSWHETVLRHKTAANGETRPMIKSSQ